MADLTLERVIGSGGFGAVYRGTWKKTTAAIKVFYARSSEREALKVRRGGGRATRVQ